jgi:hypothetical protein
MLLLVIDLMSCKEEFQLVEYACSIELLKDLEESLLEECVLAFRVHKYLLEQFTDELRPQRVLSF